MAPEHQSSIEPVNLCCSPQPVIPPQPPVPRLSDQAWRSPPVHSGDGGPAPQEAEGPAPTMLDVAGRVAAAGSEDVEERQGRPKSITEGAISVFTLSYHLDEDLCGVIDASSAVRKRSRGGSGKQRGTVSFWDDGDEARRSGTEGGNSVVMPERSSRSAASDGGSAAGDATWSWGLRRGQRRRDPSSGSRPSGEAPAASVVSIAQSEGGVSIMEGVIDKMKMMELQHEGSHDVDEFSSANVSVTTGAAGGHFWKSRIVKEDIDPEDGPSVSCTLPLAAFIAMFAVLVSVSCSTAALWLLEDLLARASVDTQLPELAKETRIKGYVVCSSMTLASVALGCALGLLLSRSLARVAKRMRSVGSISASVVASEHGEDPALALPSHVLDVQQLQRGLDRLQSNIQTFECFLPETVVSGILSGDVRAQRLHVEKRLVSIMFSDVKDFTNISESLKPQETLLLLTRYLDVMSRIAQSFQGTVAEILGDGLLVYWNTPEYVEEHWAQAATTALAQQRALVPLNAELDVMKLPRIAIRVGLHTGMVLTGNIGSLTKMKFGCMGDAVNLAARLEGLCKMYKVSVVCSGDMHQRLVATDPTMFFTRKLDVVRVKGKTVPTELFEVIGTEQVQGAGNAQTITSGVHDVNGAVTRAFAASSRVMQSVHGMHWMNTVRGAATHILRSSRTSGMFDSSTMLAGSTNVARPSVSRSSQQQHGDPPSMGSEENPEELSPTRGRRDRQRRGSYTEIMREPLLLSLAETINTKAKQRTGLYEQALEHWQRGEFVKAKALLEELLDSDDGIVDAPADLLLARVLRHIAEDGVSVANLTPEELAKWDGIRNLDEK